MGIRKQPVMVFALMLWLAFTPVNFRVNADSGDIPADEGLVKLFLQKTTNTWMLFKGSSQYGDCCYSVTNTILR